MESSYDTGDLGLGRGLKPGALCYDSDPEIHTPTEGRHPCKEEEEKGNEDLKKKLENGVCVPLHRSCSLCDSVSSESSEWGAGVDDIRKGNGTLRKLASKLRRFSQRKSRSLSDRNELTPEILQILCDIQEKQQLNTADALQRSCAINCTVATRLHTAQQEVELLKQDLELCQMQLYSKYQATKILQQQLSAVKTEKEVTSHLSNKLNRNLIQELNRVRFEFDCQENKLTSSQESWAAKFDSVCLENLRLMSALEDQNLKLRKLFSEKMALCHERDELLALMHIQDRSKYESLRPSLLLSSDPYDEFSSIELAVLGACHCRSESCSPCSCAANAACLKKDLVQAKEEVMSLKQERDSALAMVDVYRIAFEDQLFRNRNLIRQVSETCLRTNGHHEKASSPIKWFIRKGRNSFQVPSQSVDGSTNLTTDDFMQLFEDTVTSKTEALAHQKFATRLLADRVQQLEENLSSLVGDKAAGIHLKESSNTL